MEQYIVIAKKDADGKYADCQILIIESPMQIPEGYEQVHGPASEDDCKKWISENCVNPSETTSTNETSTETVPPSANTELYVVASLAASPTGIYKRCQIYKYGVVIPATHKIVFGPAIEQECEHWCDNNCGIVEEKDPRYFWLYVLQYLLIFLVTLSFVGIIWYGISKDKDFFNDEEARGLITFLVAVSTVGIATLAILTAMVLRDFKERFASAKEVLTVLVGILGTIVGFYYGQAANNDQSPNDTQTQVVIAEPSFSPSPIVKGTESILTTNLTGGTPPYQYTVTFTPPEIKEPIEKTSNEGEVEETFTIPAEVNEPSFSIEGKDSKGKTFNSGVKKIPIQP